MHALKGNLLLIGLGIIRIWVLRHQQAVKSCLEGAMPDVIADICSIEINEKLVPLPLKGIIKAKKKKEIPLLRDFHLLTILRNIHELLLNQFVKKFVSRNMLKGRKQQIERLKKLHSELVRFAGEGSLRPKPYKNNELIVYLTGLVYWEKLVLLLHLED